MLDVLIHLVKRQEDLRIKRLCLKFYDVSGEKGKSCHLKSDCGVHELCCETRKGMKCSTKKKEKKKCNDGELPGKICSMHYECDFQWKCEDGRCCPAFGRLSPLNLIANTTSQPKEEKKEEEKEENFRPRKEEEEESRRGELNSHSEEHVNNRLIDSRNNRRAPSVKVGHATKESDIQKNAQALNHLTEPPEKEEEKKEKSEKEHRPNSNEAHPGGKEEKGEKTHFTELRTEETGEHHPAELIAEEAEKEEAESKVAPNGEADRRHNHEMFEHLEEHENSEKRHRISEMSEHR
ncbi:unnamed protein product [Soboliphyme baturini]|uniref:WAP domain-containing protein n=1 Tax=Soboliphyme baturini TaxID=241478 RepID=A0A3P7ZG80_9BILA|nr:unnamed protein product [Soboliphyme baturini]